MVTNQLYIGETLEDAVAFDSADIMSMVITEECSLTGEELPSDTVEAQVSFEATNVDFYTADDEQLVTADGYELQVRGSIFSWDAFPAGTNVWVYVNGNLKGKYYLERITRDEANIFTIRAQSAIWMLDKAPFAGRWYVNKPYATILGGLLRIPGDNYTPGPGAATDLYSQLIIPEELRTQTTSLFLRPGTIRDALQAFLFANRLKLVRFRGQYMLTRLTRASSGDIPAGMEYTGGKVTVPERIGSITVKEYNVSSDITYSEVIKIEDTGAATTIYESDVPIQNIYTPPSTITSFEKLSFFRYRFTGYGSVSLIHPGLAVVTTTIGDPTSDGSHLTIDCTAVNSANADALKADLWDYYTNRQEIEVSTVDNDESCGNLYTIASPFGDTVDGYLQKNIITASGINKGAKTFITGTRPAATGYSHSLVLTESGTFQVPEEILAEENPSMRVILIGGGEGGDSGKAGKNGASNSSSWSGASGGSGGIGGKVGAPGNVFSVTLSGSNIRRSYPVIVGRGGAGGGECVSDSTANAGAPGQATTFGVYSSDDGSSTPEGFIDPITRKVYAYKYNSVFYSGGSGGDGGSRVDRGNNYISWEPGVSIWTGRVNPDGSHSLVTYNGGAVADWKDNGKVTFYSGACGGGSANGHDGGNAIAGSVSGKTVKCPSGGNGADADPKPDTDDLIHREKNMSGLRVNYGCGGLGGSGGGGGGASGCFGPYISDWGYTKGNTPTGGKGGKGGAGGAGAQGCVIILW